MAWFHKTLQDMEKAIKDEQWPKVAEILEQHNFSYKKEVENSISNISLAISEYGENLSQILNALYPYFQGHPERIGKFEKGLMELKVRQAIECARRFEETIKQLIKEEKFLE